MIGQSGGQLNRAKLNDFCRDRKLALQQQEARNFKDAKLEEIESNAEIGILPNEADDNGLPYDVWEHILNDETDPKEIMNLWEVSDGFREILKRRYVETRLPEIVKLLVNKRPGFLLADMVKLDLDKRPRYRAFPGPTTVSEVEKQKFVKGYLVFLRQLSRQCMKSADDLLYLDAVFLSFRIERQAKLQTVNEYLRQNPTKADSFFPRAVLIDENSIFINDHHLFHQEVTQFLTLVGQRIQCFSYISYQRFRKTTYDRLREWVALMPNLEKLSLKLARYQGHHPRVRRGQEYPPDLEHIPKFPVCPSLRSFEDAWKLLPAPYIQRILDASPNVTDLHLSDEGREERRQHSLQMFNALTNLISLQIVPDLAFFSHHPWTKLNKLILEKYSDEQSSNYGRLEISSCILFPILRQFEETLEHLELWIDVYDLCSHGGEFLHLKNLKTLVWNQHETIKNLNFLLYLGKLETLHIIAAIKDGNDYYGYRPGCACMKCYADKLVGAASGSFLGKSVWEVLPHLKWIQVVRKYSRRDDVFLRRQN